MVIYYALLCKQLQFVIVLCQLLHLRCSTKDHMLCTSYKVVISNYNCGGKKQNIPFSPRPELLLVPQISFARFLKNQFTSSYTGFIHPTLPAQSLIESPSTQEHNYKVRQFPLRLMQSKEVAGEIHTEYIWANKFLSFLFLGEGV